MFSFIFFIPILAALLSFTSVRAQNQSLGELPVGVWKLVEMETFDIADVPKRPKHFPFSQTLAEPYPEMAFVIAPNYTILSSIDRTIFGYAIEGDKFNIYPTDPKEDKGPVVSYNVIEFHARAITLQKISGDFVYRYYYQLSE